MKRQVLVVGLGRFGSSVATTLYERGNDVLAIDRSEAQVQEIASRVTSAVQADATSEAALKELGVGNFDMAVVSIGTNIQASLLATVLLQRLGLPYVVARAQNELHGETLEKVGADRVVYPERESGERLAHNLAYHDVVDYMELSSGFGVSKVTLPKVDLGKTLEEAELGPRSKSGLTVLLLKRGNDVTLNPDRFERIKDGDVLVVAGRDEQLERLEGEARPSDDRVARG
jgi:trk system potassium uptake protein TrkA